MPTGSQSKSTSKQQRQAHPIEAGANELGYSDERAAQIGSATVNKPDRGGKQTGSGRGKKSTKASSRAGGRASRRDGAGSRGGRAGRAAPRK
jgi:hypothetical protein